jgi:hypothetical protein
MRIRQNALAGKWFTLKTDPYQGRPLGLPQQAVVADWL